MSKQKIAPVLSDDDRYLMFSPYRKYPGGWINDFASDIEQAVLARVGAVRDQALEEAAHECEMFAVDWKNQALGGDNSGASDHKGLAAYELIEAIRALKYTAGGTSAQPETTAEAFIQAAIDSAPEPLRRLGEWLSTVLDEDQWAKAERMLLGDAIRALNGTPAAAEHWHGQHSGAPLCAAALHGKTDGPYVIQAPTAAVAEPERVVMGLGKVAVGTCVRDTDGVPGIIYLRIPGDAREHGVSTSDIYPVGDAAPAGSVLACIYFLTAQTVQQSIDTLHQLLAYHFPDAPQPSTNPGPLAAVERDAENYRFLRDRADPDDGPFVMDAAGNDLGMGETLDASIRAAITASKEGASHG